MRRPEERAQAVESLTELLDAIDRGEVDATDVQRAYIAGTRDATELLSDEWSSPRPTGGRRWRS